MPTRTYNKLNLQIIVQGKDEPAAEFAQRLTQIASDISAKQRKKNDREVTMFYLFTSASDGRQTANLQYQTFEEEEIVE